MTPARDGDARDLLDDLVALARRREDLAQQLASTGAPVFRTIVRMPPSGQSTSEIRALTREGVAAILSAHAGKRVAPQSVSRWRKESQPGGRLAGHQFPAPQYDDSNLPYWEEAQVPAILEWYDNRPTRYTEYQRPPAAMLAAVVDVDGEVVAETTSEGLAARLGVRPTMLHRYRTQSKPGGKWAADPFPPGRKGPDGNLRWTPEEVEAAVAWFERTRVGRGAGGGLSAHKRALPRWDPERRVHRWHPSMRQVRAGKDRFCQYCGAGALGHERVGECSGYDPDRAARLSLVQLGKARGKEGLKLIEAEVRAGLVEPQPPAKKAAVFELTPAGVEWLSHFADLHRE